MSEARTHRSIKRAVDPATEERPDSDVALLPDEALVGHWRAKYVRTLVIGDFCVLLVALAAAQVFRFGLGEARVGGLNFSYPVLGAGLAVLWWLSLHVHQARSPKIIGHGAEEYRRVIVATFRAFATLAIFSLLFKVDASRVYLATAFPLGLLGLLAERKVARVRLHRARAQGRALSQVLVVGGERSAAQLAGWFAKHPSAGYEVRGVWVPDEEMPLNAMLEGGLRNVPIMSSNVDLAEALETSGARAVVVTDTEHLGHESLRHLTWELEGTGIDLFLSPNVLDVSSSRLHLRDVSGMPMLHVEEPQYAGAGRVGKRLFDTITALLLLVLLSPVLLVTAVAIKLTSRGPVFYRQERIGRHEQPFRMTKFRSMVTDADAQLEALREHNETVVLFKIRQDPRVTPVGRFIRRYSLDELPQLFDVVRGSMSLVGPRPPLASEVAKYSDRMRRRMYVRPGMTGLWQVSGRSDLSFEEAERLDLAYVDNWSITGDLMIMLRTIRAVARGQGAY
ncbi:sugar transferase [Nocardioides seonyuensis]|uniref:Sugar transferase n=2 Tax=Nocardioides seonyuensis TaxID=2518371 RepID=A0A4P7IJL2_9ACTN|nr:sugar transferase [Nocardioides seonyuensis]